MKARVAAYKLLIEIARADGALGRPELEELQHYHDALGIDDAELLRETQTPVTVRVVEGSEDEREDTLRAMVQVALADGRVSRREYRWGRQIAVKLGLPGMRFVNIVRGEHRKRSAHPVGLVRRSAVTWGVLAALAGVGWNATRTPSVEASPARRLQSHAQDLDAALVLVETTYQFVHPKRKPIGKGGHGSGFFATPDGHIVTNKHVVQPWKFLADAKRLEADGYEVDPRSVRYTAWRCGSTMEAQGEALRGTWSTTAGDLQLESLAPDRWVKATRTCRDGTRRKDIYHGLGTGDLALLRATAPSPVSFIPLAPSSDRVRVLDPVVVLGFPKGPAVFERGRVISTPALGEVGKVEDSLTIRAPMDGGNSGGPIVSLDGEAIGVAARKFPGQQSLARCVRCEEVHELLDGH